MDIDCPDCGRRVTLDANNIVPYHDNAPPLRSVCRASKGDATAIVALATARGVRTARRKRLTQQQRTRTREDGAEMTRYAVTNDETSDEFEVGDVTFLPTLADVADHAVVYGHTDASGVEVVEAERQTYRAPSIEEEIGGALSDVDFDYRAALIEEFSEEIARAQKEVDGVFTAINERGLWAATGRKIDTETVQSAITARAALCAETDAKDGAK